MQHQLPRHSETVLTDWVDYNGHMNVAYYVLIFDHATDVLLNHVGLNENIGTKPQSQFLWLNLTLPILKRS
jgi:acyl-CoA thioesterase FadM